MSVLSPRAAFAAVACCFLVAMLGTTLPTPLYPLYQARFGFSELLVTAIFATYAVGVIGGLLAFGGLSDVIGRKRLLLPGLALSALSAVLFLLADSLSLLLAARLISGLSAGIFTGTATAALMDLAPGAGFTRSRATLLATAVNMLGLGMGPLLSGILVDVSSAPLRACFLVDLGLIALAAAALKLVPERVEQPTPAEASHRLSLPSVPEEMRGVFARSAMAGFAGFAVLGLFTAVAPAFLGQVLGERDGFVTGLVVLAVFVASAAGQAALDVVPAERALAWGCAVLIAGMATLALALELELLSVLVAGAVLAGFGQGLSFRAALGAVSAAAPAARRGEVSSAFFVVAYVALSIPVIGVGLLAHATDLRTAGLIFAAFVAALAGCVIVALRAFAQQPVPRPAHAR